MKKKIEKVSHTHEAAMPQRDRFQNLWLPAILLAALILRFIALTDLMGTVYGDYLLWDERVYHLWAAKIADGTYNSRAVYQGAPFPAYLMALLYRIFSPDIIYLRILNVLLGALTCFLVYLIGLSLASRETGLVACLMACLYKPFIFYSIVPLKESLSVCLFAWTAYLLVSLVTEKDSCIPETRGTQVRIGLLGLAAGLLLNVRPNAIVLLPLFLSIILWYAIRDGMPLKTMAVGLTIYLLGVSFTVLPFMIRNYRVAGQFAFTTTQSGFNLYLGNNPENPDPYYRPVPFAASAPSEQGIQFTIEASRRVGGRLSSSEASDYWSKEVIRVAASQPAVFARKLGQKALVLFNRFEACDHYDIDFVSDYAGFFKLPFLSFSFVLPFGIAGMGRCFAKYRKARALAAVFGLYGLTLIAFFTNARYRLPVLVIIIPFAAIALRDILLICKQKRFRQMIVFSASVLMVAVVEFLPVQATSDRTAYYNTHAIILDAKGLEDEAIFYWKKASEMNRPFSAFANLSLAGKHFKRKEVGPANHYLSLIPDDSFAAAFKYALLGDSFVSQRKFSQAISAYEKALTINSGLRDPRAKLIYLYRRIDLPKALREEEALKYINSFYSVNR